MRCKYCLRARRWCCGDLIEMLTLFVHRMTFLVCLAYAVAVFVFFADYSRLLATIRPEVSRSVQAMKPAD